ncbi:putative protein phosphatase 2C [Smittium culicis]|uniref:protein-serine/threonine phosphatase n=1 Tax=Smittium culicis TaxID=133412 RepID=A0A1R1YR84_9FUNG|nr:putative protein phosphatase 2C [Smittium culicis]
MGQTLSNPITTKDTTIGGDDQYIYAATSMQGWRITMEDAHTTLLNIDEKSKIAFFAVFDGHGGSNAAIFAGKFLHKHIFDSEHFAKGEYDLAIKEGFMSADSELRKISTKSGDPSGCTSVVVLITPEGQIYCGNAGDSRSILSCSGEAVELSFDHKPSNAEEYKRIVAGGGFVEFGRVNGIPIYITFYLSLLYPNTISFSQLGNLALSRALGDFDFKKNDRKSDEEQIVTALPDVLNRTLTKNDEFIVVACDGIWDCLSNQQVVHFVREKISLGMKLDEISEQLMEKCLAGESELGGVGCDNMTVVIIGILHGKSENEWYESISTAFKNEKHEIGAMDSLDSDYSESESEARMTITEVYPTEHSKDIEIQSTDSTHKNDDHAESAPSEASAVKSSDATTESSTTEPEKKLDSK